MMIRAEPGLGIGTGIGQFFTKPKKIGKSELLPVLLAAGFPTEDFLWQIFLLIQSKLSL